MLISSAPASLADVASPTGLLHTLLTVSLTAIAVLRPLYEAESAVIHDFAWVHLNPAGQQLLRQPECPTASLLKLFPTAKADGMFNKCCQAFLTGEPQRNQTHYQADGLDGYFVLAAQRCENVLVVNFLDTHAGPRAAAEEALRESQAREQTARQQAERERNLLQALLTQAPVAIGLFQGEDCVVSAANDLLCAMWGHAPAQVLGRPLLDGVPELRGQGFTELMQQVARTRVPFVGTEAPAQLRQPDGSVQTHYFNFVYQPLYAPDGSVLGVVDIAIDVTEQVLARQQMEQLNQELEMRVTARSAEAKAALFEAEKQREQAHQQQARLGQILGQMPAAIATLSGPMHRFAYFNAAYGAISADRAVLGQTVAEVFPELVEQGIIGLLDQVYTSGELFVGTEIMLMIQDAATGQPEPRYLDFTYQPLLDGQQQPEGVLVFALDVTERVRTRKQAETLQTAILAVTRRQAQERENAYQLFEQAPAAVCLLREPDHRIEYLNPAYQALFAGQELRGQTLAQVQPDNAALVTLFDGVYQHGETQFQREVPVSVPQGPGQPPLRRYFDFTYQAYREEGRIVGVSLFGFDVTERVRASQAVEAQRAELQRLFAQAPVAIALLRGPELVIELANGAVETIWGRAAAQVLGRPYFEALPETAGQGFEQILAQVLQTGQPFIVTEAPVLLPRAHTGRPVQGFVNFVFQPLFDEQGHTTGLLAMGTEVTEQVHARQQVQSLNEELATINEELNATNEELNESNRRLLRTNADLDTFVYTASHDLKAPIANIEGLLDVLSEYLPPADQEPLVPQLMHRMRGAIARFQQTVGHLTDVSHLQYHTGQSQEEVDVARVVEDVRLDLLPLLEGTQAQLLLDVAHCPPVRFALKDLRSIVYNLLSNAVKYRAPDRAPVVHIRTRCAPQQLVLEVQDNGLGLDAPQQGKLFQMFKRLHYHVEGSGVGLYLIKRLIENAGGTIAVRSAPGVGSTFTVTLPLAAHSPVS
ncbi:PAS domain-containing protein [Hymenobacter sp. BT523]|uniref:PAS domain-containing sensor histidine kinase n=1 Tax=Hymenobacter sp. BT523 TaxID=2795725 RepID=UPI0018ED0552|nr:PAS domain-containing protein [Hymenobacter sp. BT523]MBJ6107666.1 PAS domain-containing protein [Hymenobacter sp. BT523]